MLEKLRSIKTKATLAVTVCVVSLLVLVSALEMVRVRANLSELLGNQQMTLVSRMAEEIDEKLRSTHEVLIAMAKMLPPEISRDSARLRKYLEDRAGVRLLFDNLLVFSSAGMTLVDLGATGLEGTSVSDREFFQKAVSDRKPYISQPFLGRNSSRPFVVLTAPVLDRRGRVVAVLAGSLALLRPNFLGKLGTASVGKTGSFALLGRDRTIIISRSADRIMSAGPAPGVSPYFDRAVAGEAGWQEGVNSRGLHALFSYAPLVAVPWVLVAALPVEEAFAPIVATQRDIARITMLLIVLIAPLVWLGTRYLLAPLLGLHDAIRRVRSDPSAAAEVPVRSRDEIGELADDFNSLIRERTRVEASLRESEHRLRMITDNTPALIGYVDSDLRYRYCNGTYLEWFGRRPEDLLGRTLQEVLGEAAYAVREPHVREALAGREANFEVPPAVSGFNRYAHTRYVPDRRPDGSVQGFYILASDVSALKKSEEQLRESERQLSLALEGSELALFDWNIKTGEVFLSEQWSVMLGGEPQITHTTFSALEEITHPDDRPLLQGILRDALKGLTSHYRAEHRVRTNNGAWIWVQGHGQVTARDSAGFATRMVGTSADVTERKRAEHELAQSRAELERVAWYDGLTGLPNRNLLVDRLEQVLARSRRSRQPLGLFYLDLDGFKAINDSMGHAAGDALLKQFAERLRRAVRTSDTVARMGGDEFVVLLEDLRAPRDADAIASTIIEAAREEFTIDSKVLRVTTCIGIAFTKGETTGAELLKRADAALYQAKRAGRDRYHIAQADPPLDQSREAPARGRS
ncbi:MAG TPA: diguanylate cyclase [Burkholderiales bacterium]|nr:diguanylate cyclase [Burkholderiales bacterium]